jgi:glucan phosphoethanolaminetransferase (alkaline phosphatase superfamily)
MEQITLGQFFQWLTVGGGIAILLQRLPIWDSLPASVKLVIVALLNFAAPALFAALKVYVPPTAMDSTIAALIFGAFALAASFVIHKLDELLAALVVIVANKANAYNESA